MAKLRNGFYRNQFILIARAALQVGTFDAPRRIELTTILRELEADSQWARLRFALRWPQIRARPHRGHEVRGRSFSARLVSE